MAKFNKLTKSFFIVLAFVLVLIWWGSTDAHADARVEIGPSQVSTTLSAGVMLTITERIQDRYEFTLGYITSQEFNTCGRPDCDWDISPQIFVGAALSVKSPWTDNLRLNIGPYYFQNADRVGTSNFRIGLGIEWQFGRRWGFAAQHYSNAGSGPDLEICRPLYGCITNNWNTGQDSWLRLGWYF